MQHQKKPDFIVNPLAKLVDPKYLGEVEKHYHIGKEIGRGGFGVVFQGLQKRTNTPVALKYINKSRIKRYATSCIRITPYEVQIHQEADHLPGILRCYECFDVHNGFVIILERPELSQRFTRAYRQSRPS